MATETKLVIVESPAKARTIAKFLGKGYKVEASQGHIRDLPKSQIGVDVDHDFDLKYITIRGRGKILTKIRKEAKNATQILLATDPDREGEAISWHLAQTLGIDTEKPCRIEFHEVTKKAVQNALRSPRPIDMGRVDAQQARRVLDRLVGYKISPLLWAKVKKGLSAGRVQSVATRMVVMREQDIEAFIPEEYWDITARAQCFSSRGKKVHFDARLVSLDGVKSEIKNQQDAEKAVERIKGSRFAVYGVKNGERRKTPAAPFTTSSLQQEASRKLGYTTAKTMQVVQQLYEGIELEGKDIQGLVTYIRTDSVRISDDAMEAVRQYIPERFGPEYLPETPNEFKGRKNAQEAHEAIRPTDVRRTPESIKAFLTKEQFNLYRLIYSRFLASQMMPALYDTLTLEIGGNGVGLRFYGEHKKFPGYLRLRGGQRRGYTKQRNHPSAIEGRGRRGGGGCGKLAAFHTAPGPVHRSFPGAGAGGKGHRPPQHLRADHHHHHRPRVCQPGKEKAVSHGAGPHGHRHDGAIFLQDCGYGVHRRAGG